MADETNQNQQQAAQQPPQQQQQPPAIDYDKLAAAVSGRAAAAEEAALKNYLKQQGLTPEEAAQAMAAFKEQKAKNTPDPAAMRAQIAQANAAALQAQMENRAMVLAGELGLDIKTVPYVMKLADLSGAVEDGKVSDDKLKEAIGKVLEDLPQLKAKTDAAAGGFRVGADNGGSAGGSAAESFESRLRAAAGLKPK